MSIPEQMPLRDRLIHKAASVWATTQDIEAHDLLIEAAAALSSTSSYIRAQNHPANSPANLADAIERGEHLK